MKVKFFQFWNETQETTQNVLSAWLSSNPHIDVRFIEQSGSQDSEAYCLTITVWYI